MRAIGKNPTFYLLQNAGSAQMRAIRCVRNEINKKKRSNRAEERGIAYFLNAAAIAARVASACGPATGAPDGACVSKRVISSGPAARISSAVNSNKGGRGRPRVGQRENGIKKTWKRIKLMQKKREAPDGNRWAGSRNSSKKG